MHWSNCSLALNHRYIDTGPLEQSFFQIRRFLNIPYVKFMGQTLSFLIFLTIIFIYSILSRPTTETVETIGELVNASLTDRDRHILDNPSEYGLSFDVASVVVRTKNPSTLTIIMFVFVLGKLGQLLLTYKFRWRFHWSLFPGFQLTIFQHWFR